MGRQHMGQVVSLEAFRAERTVLTLEQCINALLVLLPLMPDLEGEILRLRNEIWLIEARAGEPHAPKTCH